MQLGYTSLGYTGTQEERSLACKHIIPMSPEEAKAKAKARGKANAVTATEADAKAEVNAKSEAEATNQSEH